MPTQSTPKGPKKDWWVFASLIALLLQGLCYAYLQSKHGGPKGILIFYFAPILFPFISVVFFIIALIKSLRNRPFFNKWRLIGFACLVALGFSGLIYTQYPSAYYNKPCSVAFRLPTDSTLTVGWGGTTVAANYHVGYPNQCYAYDLLITHNGKTHQGDSSKLSSYFIYGMPVLAPCAGKVVYTFDTDPDMAPGAMDGGTLPTGNHIIMEVAPHQYLFLCHLQPHSILVKKGDTVTEGQKLALAGNSGNTSEPHLHMHVQDNKNFDLGEGIPLLFAHYESNGKYVEKGIPNGGISDDGKFAGEIVKNVQKQ